MTKWASSGGRRSLLHKDKLIFFKHWVLLPAQGYIERSPTGHAYEVLRIAKHTLSGDNPDVFFYLKDPPTQHVTLDRIGELLVKKWLRSKKAPKDRGIDGETDEQFGARFDIMEAYENGNLSIELARAQLRDTGLFEEMIDEYLDNPHDKEYYDEEEAKENRGRP